MKTVGLRPRRRGLVDVARAGYRMRSHHQRREATGSPRPASAARRALDAGLAAHTPHFQAEALGQAAGCDLAPGAARRAVAMHRASCARLAESTARSVLAHALGRDGDATGA